MSAVVLNGDTSGAITIAAPAIAGANTFTLPSVTGTGALTSQLGMRNRIINGAMVIDQRNAGASVTPSNSYTLDRWYGFVSQASKYTVQQNAGSVTPPAGFTNYLGLTSSSAYSITSTDTFGIAQYIEGFNTADLNWGTVNAKTVTLSFWVRSSLTGTFGGALANSGVTRSYPFTYSIPVANTWTQISVTVAGDTTGSWVGSTNGLGMRVWLSVGSGSTYSGTAGSWAATDYRSATGAVSVVGTSGATFYITGVQLEVGSFATGYEYRQYQQELALCQRYYVLKNCVVTTSSIYQSVHFPVQMRAYPTIGTVSFESGTGATFNNSSAASVTAFPTYVYQGANHSGIAVASIPLSAEL